MWNSCATWFQPRHFGMPMGLLTILVLFFLILAVFKLFTKKSARPDGRERIVNTDTEDTLHILKVRLAKGEIDVEEFNRLKSYL